MDFEFSEDQKMLQAMVRDFAIKELEPVAAQIDEEARFPAENIKKAAALGLFGVGFPEEYGGSGGGAVERAIVNEELSRVCASTNTAIGVSMGLAGPPIYKYGNEEQRRRFVAPIARGENLPVLFSLNRAPVVTLLPWKLQLPDTIMAIYLTAPRFLSARAARLKSL